jgi:membrane-bound lytic murein transglycosylase D
MSLSAISAQRGFAAVRPAKKSHAIPIASNEDFPTDPFVRRQIRFWESIFQKYKSNSVVIHDIDDPLAMLDVIDFDRYVTGDGKLTSIEDSDQTPLVQRYIDRYMVAIERFAKYKDGALKFGPIEQRVFEVYSREPQMLSRLYGGNIRLRGQGGLADTFLAAANRAQEYMPYMEATFRKYGLPITLSRLPFVESMFNLNAKSKVGASGLWQFMPDTAREYMYVGALVDERNNPYKATHGAAQLFMANYRELGSWPLAITAYNHGRGGMGKAAKTLGTSQLGNIINNYKSPSFGFASKNFYSEFLAAVRTYDLVTRTGLVKTNRGLPAEEAFTLKRAMTVREISRITKLPTQTIAKLNPCLNSSAVGSKIDQPLPINYEIRLPKAEKSLIRRSIASIPSSKSSFQTNRR